MNLFGKLLLLAVAPPLVTIISIAVVNWSLSETIILDEVDTSARAELAHHASIIVHFFEIRMRELERMASHPVMVSGGVDAIERYVAQHEARLGQFRFDRLYFIDAEGWVHRAGSARFNIQDRDYYPALERGGHIISTAIESRDTGERVVLLLAPIYGNEGERIGAVGGTMPLQGLLDIVSAIDEEHRGFALLIDSQGTAIAGGVHGWEGCETSPPRVVLASGAGSEFAPVIRQALDAGEGETRAELFGEPWTIHFAPVPGLDWRLAIAHHKRELLAGALRLRNATMLILAVALLAVAGITFFVHRALVRPIRGLIDTHAQFGAGGLAARVPVRGRDEIAALAQSFNDMAEQLNAELESRREAQAAARESEQRLQGILDHTTALIYMKDPANHYTLANNRFAEFFGISVESIIGKTDFDLFPPEIARQLQENDRQVLAECRPCMFEEHVQENGDPRTYVSLKFPIYGANGALSAVCGISTDITERKRAEEELARHRDHLELLVAARTAELEATHAALVEKERMAALGGVMAMVSHEIRNPLGTIAASMYTIASDIRGLGKERAERALDRVERSVLRCSAIIEELLDYTRTSGLQRQARDIDAWLASVLDEFAVSQHIHVRRHLDARATVEFDAERLRRCVVNLMLNAQQAIDEKREREQTPPETGSGEIAVRTSRERGRVALRVADTGAGILPDHQNRVFEPLFSTKSFGVGLGLSIVKQIAEQHGGSVEITSTPATGTEVTIWLPLEPVSAAAAARVQ